MQDIGANPATSNDPSTSNVDLFFDCDGSQCLRADGFEDRISEMSTTKAHLSSAKYIKPKIHERVLSETSHVFLAKTVVHTALPRLQQCKEQSKV